MKRFRGTRLTGLALTALLTLVGLTPVSPSQALDGSKFDPGLIISDSVFFDFGSMTADEIQRFLESQVPVCKSGSDGMPCLRNYKTDTPEKSADPGKCAYMPAQKNISAAQIIYNISRACGINPRVLLVTLQKEQGLVQSAIPSPYMYRAAMGYGCPDNDPAICGKVWVGLFNQLYKAAGQFQWYGDPNGSFTYLRPGRTVSIAYNEVASKNCGRKTFLLKSQATANLYYYTPYTPNDAALKNLRGLGDRCSAYGNRNFWRFYWDWFGSPIGGGFLLKSSTSDPYFISNDVKYPLADPSLVDALKPLGPLGEISQDYLDSFPTGIPMTRIIKSPAVNGTSAFYFVSSGKKYFLSSCDQATNFGLDCTKAVELTRVQLDALPTGQFRPDITAVAKSAAVAPATPSYFMVTGSKKYPLDCAKAANLGFDCTKATEYTQAQLDALSTVRLSNAQLGISAALQIGEGRRVVIKDGLKREVLDDFSLSDAQIPLLAPSPLSLTDFAYLPWGPPIAADGSMFLNRATTKDGVYIGGTFYEIDPETKKDIDFSNWFRKSSGSLGADGLSKVVSATAIKSLISDDSELIWVLTKTGRLKVEDRSSWISSAVALPDALVQKIPIQMGTLTGFDYVRASGQKTIFRFKDGLLRATFNESDRSILGQGMANTEVLSLSPSALNLIPKGVMVFPAGLVVRNRLTKITGVIDGNTRLVTFGANSAKLALPEARALSNLQLSGYPDQEVLNPFKVSCAGQIYIAANSLLYETNATAAKEYPGRATQLSDPVCAQLTIINESFGRYFGVKTKDPVTGKTLLRAYKVKAGKKLPFKTLKDYKKDNIADPPLIWVDQAFADNFVSGSEISLGGQDQSPDPDPAPKPKTYTIVAGDSLTSIATRFGTTVTKLMALNNIVNADRIRIGQVLRLP
ncbi:MAG: LysM peptidoglycan-binding domain-containing protein [Rhodoluna sp.]